MTPSFEPNAPFRLRATGAPGGSASLRGLPLERGDRPRPHGGNGGTGAEALRDSLFLARLDDLINWSRSNSLWPMFFGLSCCFVEMATSITPRHDLSRFGSEVMRGSPRQADLMVIAGTVFKKVAPAILRLYEQISEPRWVISMGSCSNSGGMYDVYSVVQGVETLLPVDMYVQGCPPRPESLIESLILLQKKIRSTERPTRQRMVRDGDAAPLVIGETASDDPRGPGMEGTRPRGTILRPQTGFRASYFRMWRPPSPLSPRIEFPDGAGGTRSLATVEDGLRARLEGALEPDHGRFGPSSVRTWRVAPQDLVPALEWLRNSSEPRFRRLEFAAALDNRPRGEGFRTVYHLAALEPGKPEVRLAVDLEAGDPHLPTVTGVYPVANWYEREMLDLFGIRFAGHPDPRRIYMPSCWRGHPMRKDHPYRATEMAPFTAEHAREMDAAILAHSRIRDTDDGTMVLNMGPHHPATHGVLRIVLKLHGEEIQDLDLDIGFHHRGPEKIAERQNWHRFIPYTDRVDYLAGVNNNLPYVMAVEQLAGVAVPERAQVIRVLMCELFRIVNHQVWVGTFAQDIGALTPVFYTFEHREQIFDFVSKVTGGRMHPSWFRIGGVAQDLPEGWREDMEAWLARFPAQLDEVERLLTGNPIFLARARGTGRLSAEQAVELGFSGPNLRASGVNWDLRRDAPYSGYERYAFEVPTASGGDNYDRYLVRLEEMRQSHRIIAQCVRDMPDGDYVTPEYRYAVPEQDRTLVDIETLIHHFINVSRGFEPPAGDSYAAIEGPKGEMGYFVVSDGGPLPYRVFIRMPSFVHMQSLLPMVRGAKVADLVTTLGAIDFVLGDVDK